VELDEQAIARVQTVRDLLQEVSSASTGATTDLEAALKDPERFLDDDQRKWLEPLTPAQAVLARMLFAVNRGLMRICFRVSAVGLEHVPAPHASHASHSRRGAGKSGCVIAPNHVSYLDSCAIAAALDHARLRNTCWAAWTGVAFRNPLMRWMSRLARLVPIDPDRAVLSSLAFAAAVLKRGENLVWFPEGGRSPDGRLQPLRPGIGILLEHEPAMVVPTCIEGAYEAMPTGRLLPKPHRIFITFGEAVDSHTLERDGKPSQASGERHEWITRGLQDRLERLAPKAARPRAKASRRTKQSA